MYAVLFHVQQEMELIKQENRFEVCKMNPIGPKLISRTRLQTKKNHKYIKKEVNIWEKALF